MSIFKINHLPGSTLPQQSLIYSAYQQLDKSQWLSISEIEENQLKQLNWLLQYCYDNSPYYKMVIIKSGLNSPQITNIEEFRKISTLSRFNYQNYFNFIKIDRLPNGVKINPDPIFTSGTTGVPIKVFKTNRDELWWQAFAMRDCEWNKMDPLKKVGSIKLLAMSPDKLKQALKGVSTQTWFPSNVFQSSPAFAVDIRLEPSKQLNWLSAINPNYLISLPSNLDVLSNLIKNNLKFSNLEFIQVIGETLTDIVKNNIQDSFGVPVKNLYSSNECGYMASECPEGHGMHVHAENILAEVLDENDNPCKPGETGRLVVTSLTNFVNPFIRYEILDYVTLADGPCPCGRGLPLWKKVEGRMHPMLFLKNGTRKASTGLMLGIRQIGGVHQFQIIQKTIEHFIVKVIPSNEWTADHGNRIIKYVQNEVESEVTVEIQGHEFLDRPNGKLKIVIVEVDG